MRFGPAEHMTSTAVLAVNAWYGACEGGGWPARDAFRPESLPAAVLGNLGLVDVETQPFRVLYRVVGELLCESVGRQVRMTYLDALGLPQEAELAALYRRALAAPGPLFLRGDQHIDGHPLRYEGACFPLGRPDDEIRRFVLVEDFLDTESWRAILRRRRYHMEDG